MDILQKRLLAFTRAIIEGSKRGIKEPTIINDDVVVIPTVKGAVAFGGGDCFKIIIREQFIDTDVTTVISKILFTTAYYGEFGGCEFCGFWVYFDYTIKNNGCCWVVNIYNHDCSFTYCEIEIEYISEKSIEFPDPFNDEVYMVGEIGYDVIVGEYGID